jgi:hypothetical protein
MFTLPVMVQYKEGKNPEFLQHMSWPLMDEHQRRFEWILFKQGK